MTGRLSFCKAAILRVFNELRQDWNLPFGGNGASQNSKNLVLAALEGQLGVLGLTQEMSRHAKYILLRPGSPKSANTVLGGQNLPFLP